MDAPQKPRVPQPGDRLRSRDGQTVYVLQRDGSLRSAVPKVRGKAARKAEKRARRMRGVTT